MAKKSRARRIPQKQANSGLNAAPALHPMFQKTINQIAKETEQRIADDMAVWDQLNEQYLNASKAITSAIVVGQLTTMKHVIPFIQDQAGLRTRLDMLKNDVAQLKSELSEIAKQHVHLTGGTNDPDEVMKAAMIGQQYVLFIERVEAAVPNTIGHIADIFADAELRYNAAQLAAQQPKEEEIGLTPEQDPSVITDVEVSTTTQ
jgi:hypothetical protein